MAADIRNNTPQTEALILFLDDRPAAGKQKLDLIRREQLEDYSEHLKEATIIRRPADVAGGLRRGSSASRCRWLRLLRARNRARCQYRLQGGGRRDCAESIERAAPYAEGA